LILFDQHLRNSAQPSAPCFDLDVLRTLVFAVDLGGFSRAAARVGRTQSAVSLQMRRLEELAGERLFEKAGRSFAVTTAGERMLGYARRLLALNDEAYAAVRDTELVLPVRLGLLPDFAETWLPPILASFVRSYPAARLEAHVDRGLAVLSALDQGRLDLALVFGIERPTSTRIAELAMTWIAGRHFTWRRGSSLPLVVFEPPCAFRAAAIAALDRAGVPWHVAFTSQSLGGIWAAVEAGLGVTVRTPHGLPRRLRPLGAAAKLPPLPSIALALHRAAFPASPLVDQLRTTLEQGIASLLNPARPPARRRPAR
jgi:DNA-binding transcriptional LysR family regulator